MKSGVLRREKREHTWLMSTINSSEEFRSLCLGELDYRS